MKNLLFYVCNTQTTFPRAAFGMQQISKSVHSCLDSITSKEGVMEILRSNASPELATSALPANDMVETEHGFVYQTYGGTVFGIFAGYTWADVPIEGNRYGDYVLVLGFTREGSLTKKVVKEWPEAERMEIQSEEGWIEILRQVAEVAEAKLATPPTGRGHRTGRRN